MLVRKTVIRGIGENGAGGMAENHHSAVHTGASILEEKDSIRSDDVESVEEEKEKEEEKEEEEDKEEEKEEEEEEIGTVTLPSDSTLPSSLPHPTPSSASITASNTEQTPEPIHVIENQKQVQEGKGKVEVEGRQIVNKKKNEIPVSHSLNQLKNIPNNNKDSDADLGPAMVKSPNLSMSLNVVYSTLSYSEI